MQSFNRWRMVCKDSSLSSLCGKNPSKIGQKRVWSLLGVKSEFMTGKVQVYDG